MFRIRSLPIIVPKKNNNSNSVDPEDWNFKDRYAAHDPKKISEVLKYCYGNGKYCS